MATSEEQRAARDAKLDALHEQLTDAVESLVSGEDWKQALTFAARFRARSFNNTLLKFYSQTVRRKNASSALARACSLARLNLVQLPLRMMKAPPGRRAF